MYQDSPADARRYVHDFGGDWPRALDPGGHMAIDYGVVGVPETFFIDRSGRVAYKEVGYSSYGLLVQEIERLLDQRRTSR